MCRAEVVWLTAGGSHTAPAAINEIAIAEMFRII
jgi:hypothetical protein